VSSRRLAGKWLPGGWLASRRLAGRTLAGRTLAGRTLSARLILGVMLLLAGACAVIGAATYVAVRHSMVSSLDAQLQGATTNYVGCLNLEELRGQEHRRPPGAGAVNPASHPPPNSNVCSQGQPQGMLGVNLGTNGSVTYCSIVAGRGQNWCQPSAADTKALRGLPADDSPASVNDPVYDLNLASLDGNYRLTSARDAAGETLITGLPMGDVSHTLGQVALAELIVFLSVLLLAGVLSTVLVRISLRPLRRVAATATLVAELPLETGEVTLPAGVPDSDPRTEVGQVGAAFNRMLGHVERALGRRAASEARLRRFAADASHELRTPLSAIRGYAEFALRHPGPVPEEVTHALRRVQSESLRMGVLVDDLLLLARLDAGRPLERAPVDLSRLAIDVTSDAHVARREHRWQLDLPDDPVMVLGDEHRLHQVLANLLSNAGKHTPPGTTVAVTLSTSEQSQTSGPLDTGTVQRGTLPPAPRVVLSVTDDGPGIPPELLPELFERFSRADTSRARNGDSAGTSTGLGLAIVDAVVAAHNGAIVVTSRAGMTRFAMVLPMVADRVSTVRSEIVSSS
jgi:two-component system, OmpR family, sensor kinase